MAVRSANECWGFVHCCWNSLLIINQYVLIRMKGPSYRAEFRLDGISLNGGHLTAEIILVVSIIMAWVIGSTVAVGIERELKVPVTIK